MAITKPPIPLEDIVLSPLQGFWPLAPGWWILITIIILSIGWLSYAIIKKRVYHKLYNKQLKTLDTLEKYLRNNQLDTQELFKVLNRILKLFLVHYSTDKEIIALSGNNFKTWVESKTTINPELSPIFDDFIYKKSNQSQNNSCTKNLSTISQFRLLLKTLDASFMKTQDASK